MSRQLEALLSHRDDEGRPSTTIIQELHPKSMMIAEHIDRDEFTALCADARHLDLLPHQVGLVEWDSQPQYVDVTDESEAFGVAMENGWKDVFIAPGDGATVWHPASEDWYVLFADARFSSLLDTRRDTNKARLDEWLSEEHHSDAGRAFLKTMRARYSG